MKKFKKITSLSILVVYLMAIFMPTNIEAEEFIQSLDYSYWRNDDTIEDHDPTYDNMTIKEVFDKYYKENTKEGVIPFTKLKPIFSLKNYQQDILKK